jgi:predicted permease
MQTSIFTKIRYNCLVTLMVLVGGLAFVGILSIWEVLSKDVLDKTLSSLAVLIFSSLLIVLTTLERDNKLNVLFRKNGHSEISVWRVLGLIILTPIIIAFIIGLYSSLLGHF